MSVDVNAYLASINYAQYFLDGGEEPRNESDWLASSVLSDLRFPFSLSAPDRSAALAVAALNNSGLDSFNRPAKRKRARDNEKKVLPKSDIRNTYVNCYYNAINSGDKQLLKKILDSIAAPDVVLTHTFVNRELNNFMPNFVEIYGIEAIASAVADFMKAAPDTYIQILSQDLEVLPDGDTMVTAEYSMEGTKVMELTGFPEDSDNKVVLSSRVNIDYDLEDTYGKKLQVDATMCEFHVDPLTGLALEVVQSVERFGVGMVSEYPTIIDIPIARTTFFINKDKKIYKIVAVK